MNAQGLLIAIEGIDGCGKSTLARGLHDHLSTLGYSIILTKEPGDTPLGETIRNTVQHREVPICAKAEYLLFAADRAQHAAQVIAPALDDNKIIISDRMGDSSIVYQGYARGLDIDIIKQVNAWALMDRHPDVTIFVTLDPALARQRCISRNQALTAFEKEKEEFMQKVHTGFCTLYTDRSDVIHINNDQQPKCMVAEAHHALLPWLKTYEQRTRSTCPTMARLS